jgi:catechol 2,3-dioxygenase-like lactoylglutathione lyase family enzyme
MSSTQTDTQTAAWSTLPVAGEIKLEAVGIPVADIERSKEFYASLGWRLDADFDFAPGVHAVQFTPPGSAASVQFGTGGPPPAPGPIQGLLLVVSDIDAAREDLLARGVAVSGVFHREGADAQVPGPSEGHADYNSFAAFSDPDGNTWVMQEVRNRLPGR